MWGKLHQFANELMAPIDEEEDEEEYYDKDHHHKQHHQNQHSSQKEDEFFSQTFLSQPQTHQTTTTTLPPPQQRQHSSSSLLHGSHKRTTSSASFGGQTTTSRDSPISMQHSASYQYLPNAAAASSYTSTSQTLSSSPPNLHYQSTQSNFKSSLLETASTFFKSASPSSQNRTHSPFSDHSAHSTSIKSPIDNVSDGGVSSTPSNVVITSNQQQQFNNTISKQSSVSTPIQHVNHSIPQIPGFLLNGHISSLGEEITKTDDPNYIHVKLCIGEEITYNDQHVEYLQSQITYLQHEIANQADRYEKEKIDLKHLLENTQHLYREQNLKLNEFIEQNRRLEYDLQQLNTNTTNHVSKLESKVNELTNHKKQLVQTINEKDDKIEQILTELQKEQANVKQYNIEMERERSMARTIENQNSESQKLLQEREKELANLELALEQLQMLSGKEASKLKQVIKQKDEEISELKENSLKLLQNVSELDILRQQVEQYREKIDDLESSCALVNDSNNSQTEVFKRMLEDCTSRLNDENLIDRRVVSRMLLALVSNHADTRQQQAIFKFFLKTLNINNQDDEQLLQQALVFLQQERYKQLLSRKKTFSELFVNYLLEEGNKTTPVNK